MAKQGGRFITAVAAGWLCLALPGGCGQIISDRRIIEPTVIVHQGDAVGWVGPRWGLIGRVDLALPDERSRQEAGGLATVETDR